MSDLFFERMRRELFVLFVNARRDKVQHELDEEVERITGTDCDAAARALSKEDFKRVAEEAMENIIMRRKRQKIEQNEKKQNELNAYA